MQPSMNRFGIAVVSLALIVSVAACGSDGSSASTEPVAPADTTAASAAAFPVTIAHKYGEITIDKEPQRVVSIGFTDQDWLLALGVTPIAIREWYGEQPYATWPWAQDELGDAKPAVLPSAELNFEEIAALQPDLIVGVSSGITESDYATLSEIAPTLAQPGDYVDYGTPWDVTTELIGGRCRKECRGSRGRRSCERALRGCTRCAPGVRRSRRRGHVLLRRQARRGPVAGQP